MRVNAETHRSHGVAILKAASRLLRERGLAAVSVGDVSAAAGLTHGAFYGHFTSKAALQQAACRDALAMSATRFRMRAETAGASGGDRICAIIDGYLTEWHRDNPQDGCPIAAIGGELVRGDSGSRAVLADGAAMILTILEDEIRRIEARAGRATVEQAAAGVLSALIGGMMVARAIKDPECSGAALDAAKLAARAAAGV